MRTSVRIVSLSTNQKGAIAEAAITADAVRLGLAVYRPAVEGCRYDLIFDVRGRLVRVQCKWAALGEGVVVIRTRTSRFTPAGYVRTTYGAEEIDGFAAYCDELKECYWLPIEEFAGQGYVHLRLRPARNGQQAGLKWCAQYPLGAIAQLGERLAGSQKVVGSSPTSSTANVRPLR
jgi:hypothetical protein